MNSIFVGELAAIGTAFLWSLGIVIMNQASKRIGVMAMCLYRLPYGVAWLLVIGFVLNGNPFPTGLSLHQWLLIGTSGLLGFYLCDYFLFQSCVDISPRLAILLFNVSPFINAFLGWLWLNETLSWTGWLGIVITLCGIFFVLSDKVGGVTKSVHFKRGVVFALLATVCQALSFATAKSAMTSGHAVDARSVTLIRALAGAACFWTTSLVTGKLPQTLKLLKDTKSLLYISIGAVFGLVIGVWLSMIAIKLAPMAIAATLMSLMPITVLPINALINKEKISPRALIGACIACVGIAVLFNFG